MKALKSTNMTRQFTAFDDEVEEYSYGMDWVGVGIALVCGLIVAFIIADNILGADVVTNIIASLWN